MTLDELNNLDMNNVGDWPIVLKLIIIIVLGVAVLAAVYYLDTEDQIIALEAVEAKEVELRAEFEKLQQKAANLEGYKQQLAEMQQSFGAMLRQLPNKTEVPDLLVDVSQTGLAAGLEFDLFKPTGERPKEFYAEFPIKIEVRGEYEEFGEFVSGLAALPRIVTIHNVKITPLNKNKKKKGKGGSMKMTATAKTYRYLEEK